MIVRKTLLATAAAALMSTPAWALPSQTPSNQGTEHAPATTPVGPPSETPNNADNPGSANRNPKANQSDKGSNGSNHGDNGQGNQGNGEGKGDKGHGRPSHPGKSHRCVPHGVAYVASGSLVKWTLTKDENANTYSGEVEVEVTRTNHHAIADMGKAVDYKVSKVHVTFAVPDMNKDGTVGPDDLVKNDGTRLIGKITMLPKRCSQTGFTAEETIHRIVFHAPPPTPPTPPAPKS